MKKVGKFRQWADEKLGTGTKTQATEDFRDMQAEMHRRHQGLEQIHSAAQIWIRSLSKKKEGPDKEKNIPVELLGLAAHQHGEDFGPESAYGALLKRVGTCQQQVARAQDVFTTRTTETVIENMERSLAQMKEYQAAVKKLESRRLTYDSSLGKVQKAKREDSKLEEELRAAKVRYEEISDDVEHRMHAIRQGEADLVLDFGELITLERTYFESCVTAVSHLQTWYNKEIAQVNDSARSASQRKMEPQTERSPLRSFSRPQYTATRSNTSLHTPPASTTGTEEPDPFFQEPGTTAGIAPGMQMLGVRALGTRRPSHRSDSGSSEDDGLATRPIPRRTATEPNQPSLLHNNKTVKANFAFEAEAATELSLRPGDVICVLEEVSAGWWQGQRIDERSGAVLGQAGLFPSNYCTVLPAAAAATKRQQAPRPPMSSTPSLHEQDIEGLQVASRSQTFPRVSMQQQQQIGQSQTIGIREGSGNKRPPPPPVPKKKTTGVMPPTPQRS
ncbi:hypothetical protein BCR37DRAFT_82668 [Protomyces lactucae-debilis]|uniref:BAR domain-domain-containing protein n=1 Tax=Protomyces lactucae-debilis TaxID=2754530 RepID=A0A1Y2F7T8_PROLT|nr:uncharacterized protein BCR37DRAFT_82668 [Protomyces lactucae-debilis]ORY79980.1 hypothetical protein BCR37DRAFT_82668 [Protomyces lactucae-debilis]